MEEAFANKLQLLAHKVISKKPDFQKDLDATLKHHYVNQLYNHNIASIAKTFLIQMPKVTFNQFQNELTWVLGTHQHSKGNVKSVSVVSMGTDSDEGETQLKSQWKHKNKISAGSSQIKDLHSKLDSAITENSQMQEFLNPSTLQMVVYNVLHAAQASSHSHSYNSGPRQGKPFLGWSWEPQLSAGKDRTTDPEKTCRY